MPRGESDERGFGIVSMVFTLLAVILAFSALAVAGSAWSRSNDAKDAAQAAGGGTTVTETEFALDPTMVDVEPGATITAVNAGKVVHNLGVKGTKLETDDIQPGDRATLDLGDLKPGTYELYCAIPGHAAAGMRATLMVGGGGAGGAGAQSGTAGGSAAQLRAENDRLDLAQKKPVDAYVKQLTDGPNTKGVGNQPLAPTVQPDGTKEFDIAAKVIDWEVEPGKTVRAWAYGPTGTDQFTVPGPLIRVEPGDRVRVVFDNQLPQSSAIHFHGIITPLASDGVPWVTQDPVKPGEKFTYEFTARGPAVGMYHSHHHAEHQVPDGLAGAFIIGDEPVPAGANVTQRVPMVLNDAGVIGLSLNGKSFPATAPVMAKVGDWVQIDYFNEGLQIHPMHLHGLPQLVIAKDGNPLPTPYTADVVDVAPGERYSVLVHATPEFLGPSNTPGVWAFHCHILNHAEREDGMFGMVTTFIVTPS